MFFVEVRHHLGKAAPLVVHIVTGKGQRDGGARVGGFVDGSDQLNGLAAFGTVYKQSFFPTDRPQEVEQLGRVAFTLEIGQIIVIFLQLFLFFPIFLGEAVDHGGVGRHVPRHCNAGLFAIELYLLRFVMVHDGGGKPHQLVRIVQDGNAQILAFGVVVPYIADDRVHAFRHSKHPLHQVDMVHTVARHRAGGLLIPCASPPQVVVALSAPPQRIHSGKQHLADEPLVQDLFHLLVGGLAAILHHHA